jgi:rubrerythrin
MTENNYLADMLEPLKVALRLEQEGKRFFSEAAATVKGKAARQTFEFLAAEEDKHIRRIEELYRSLEESEGNAALDTEDSDAELRFVAFNDRLAELRNEIKPTISDIEAYQTALKFENGAEDFYSEQVAKSTDPKIRKFYSWLIHEESMHAKVLNSCLRFAEDPATWFQERGKSG